MLSLHVEINITNDLKKEKERGNMEAEAGFVCRAIKL